MEPLGPGPGVRARRLLVALSAFALLACAPGARAQERDAGPGAPRLVTASPRELLAGERVAIEWDAAGAGIEELELQLSLDGGRHWSLRVSPELDGARTRFVWRVPNLAAAEARLRIRFHRDGREREGAAGEPFRIVARDDLPPERELVHESGWWELFEEHRERGPVSLAGDAPAFSAGEEPPVAEESPRAGALAAPAPRPIVVPVARAVVVAAGRVSTPASPRVFPRRE
jgi:hypothetical protein